MNSEKQKQFLISLAYYTSILVLAYVLFHYVLPLFSPFLIGFAIAYILRPIVYRIAQGFHIHVYSTLFLFLFYCALASLCFFVILKCILFLQDIFQLLPAYYNTNVAPYLTTTNIEAHLSRIHEPFQSILQTLLLQLHETLFHLLTQFTTSLFTSISKLLLSLPKLLFAMFLSIISSFFINADYQNITNSFLKLFPITIRKHLLHASHIIKDTLKQMVKAYSLLMLCTFLQLWIGFLLLHINNAFLLAIGIALFDILPLFGSGSILLPWALYSYVCGKTKLSVGILILHLIISISRSILEPKILSAKLGQHPFITLVAMYVGGKLFGILGMLFSPLICLLIQKVKQENNVS